MRVAQSGFGTGKPVVQLEAGDNDPEAVATFAQQNGCFIRDADGAIYFQLVPAGMTKELDCRANTVAEFLAHHAR